MSFQLSPLAKYDGVHGMLDGKECLSIAMMFPITCAFFNKVNGPPDDVKLHNANNLYSEVAADIFGKFWSDPGNVNELMVPLSKQMKKMKNKHSSELMEDFKTGYCTTELYFFPLC